MSFLNTVFSPVANLMLSPVVSNTVDTVSNFLNVLPDPSKEDTMYDDFHDMYNKLAKTMIALPDELTDDMPGLALGGDIVSSAVSAVFKDLGVVADHLIMTGAQFVDGLDVVLTGGMNMAEKFMEDPDDMSSLLADESTDEIDSISEIAGHLMSYNANVYEGHIIHDTGVLASPFDLVVDIFNDIEDNTGFKVPGSDLFNSVVDSTVMSILDVNAGVFDALRDVTESMGMPVTSVGTMTHDKMDHVGEGNIREGYDQVHGGMETHGDDHDMDHGSTDSDHDMDMDMGDMDHGNTTVDNSDHDMGHSSADMPAHKSLLDSLITPVNQVQAEINPVWEAIRDQVAEMGMSVVDTHNHLDDLTNTNSFFV